MPLRRAVRAGRSAELLSEDRAHVRRASEPRLLGDRLEFQLRGRDQFDRAVEANADDLVIERPADHLAETALKDAARQRNRADNVVDGYPAARVVANESQRRRQVLVVDREYVAGRAADDTSGLDVDGSFR